MQKKIDQMEVDIMKLLELLFCCLPDRMLIQDDIFWDEVGEIRSRYVKEKE